MFTLKRLTTLAAMVVALALVAPIAFAQTKILVIDQARIERDSKAGQSIRTALQGINTQMQNELSPIQTTYQSQQTALQGKVQNMTPEAVQADQTIQNEYRALQTKAAEVSREQQVREAEMRMTQRKAAQAYSDVLGPVLREVLAEEGGDIIVDVSQVIMIDDGVDVSAKVIAKLDAAAPSITVTRERLPQQPAASQ